jgi:hypothetical protein
MSDPSGTVDFTFLFKKGPLTDHDKRVLIEKVTAIIEAASGSITVETMVHVVTPDLINKIVQAVQHRDEVKSENNGGES